MGDSALAVEFNERMGGTDHHRFADRVGEGGLSSAGIQTIQVNVGLKCNQQCVHCHVNASPYRKEVMDWETMAAIAQLARAVDCRQVDITGGAPELNPHFRRFVTELREASIAVTVRTNLTVLLEPEMKDMPKFYRKHRVQLVASLPCYLEENVDAQRGDGVYRESMEALKLLNAIGYGINPDLSLTLVYNPGGPSLPPDQASLESAYRAELKERFGIHFTRLFTITNVPIGRFLIDLRKREREQAYMELLLESFNADTVDQLMCRHQISVKWDGRIYDCDFNLALGWAIGNGRPFNVRDVDPQQLLNRAILTGDHCYACTAGCGSSCGGALV